MYELPNRPYGSAEHIETSPNYFYLEQPYLDYLYHIYCHGTDKGDRTGTGARSIFGHMMRFNLQRGLPLPTTKFVSAKSVFDELKWFLEGSTNNNRLREINQMHSKTDWSQRGTIWEEWANKVTGELGPVYGYQWLNWPGRLMTIGPGDKSATVLEFEQYCAPELRGFPDYDACVFFEGINQVQNAINALRNGPDSRRIIISAWNPADVDKMALPPCHLLYQFYSRPATWHERRAYLNKHYGHIGHDCEITHEYMDEFNVPRRVLNCMMYQRSADSFLGVPYNIASYSMLTYMFAHQCDMIAGEFVWVGGDCHIYSNHFSQVELQLSRTPSDKVPQLSFNRKPDSIFEYDWLDLSVTNYEHQGKIEAQVAI